MDHNPTLGRIAATTVENSFSFENSHVENLVVHTAFFLSIGRFWKDYLNFLKRTLAMLVSVWLL